MPPWTATSDYGEFIGQRPLGDAEIDLIQRWVDQGAVERDLGDLPPAPKPTDGWQLGKPDLVVTLPEPYMLPAEGASVFRNFVIPVPVDGARYIKGLEFHSGNARVVHHSNIRIDPTRASRRLDEEDPAPGYEGLIPRSAVYPDGHFLAWTPGQVAPLLPRGLAWRLDPGTDLAVEVHRAGANADLAWTLATSREEAFREAGEAVRLAEHAATLTEHRDPAILDVLAAAHAAAGEFDRAIDVSEAALRLGPPPIGAAAIRARRELYRQGQPYRRP